MPETPYAQRKIYSAYDDDDGDDDSGKKEKNRCSVVPIATVF